MTRFSSIQHVCQATKCAELRRDALTNNNMRLAEFWTEVRVQKLYDAEIEKRREDLRERLKP